MPLKQQLTEDMKTAMRARDSIKLGAIRFLQAEIRNIEIDHGDQDEVGIQKIIARQIKQMRDGISEYKKAAREDLIGDEEAKIAAIAIYLPQQLSDEELSAVVARITTENLGMNMGQLMGLVMKEVSGVADGGRVSAVIKAKLA